MMAMALIFPSAYSIISESRSVVCVQVAVTILKVALILLIVVAGLGWAIRGTKQLRR